MIFSHFVLIFLSGIDGMQRYMEAISPIFPPLQLFLKPSRPQNFHKSFLLTLDT